jgi:hypothetical protein
MHAPYSYLDTISDGLVADELLHAVATEVRYYHLSNAELGF